MYSIGPLSRMLLLLLVLMTLAGCVTNPMNFLKGGGTNVAANTQIGKENYQGINTSVDRSIRPVARAEGPVETIDQSTTTTNNTEIDPFLIILLVLGWLLPSPAEIGRGILKLLRLQK